MHLDALPTPWTDEPDHLDLVLSGFRCEIERISHGRHLCGYIVLPDLHPLHGLHYDDGYEVMPAIHGGWTLSEEVDGNWTIGFDWGSTKRLRGMAARLKRDRG